MDKIIQSVELVAKPISFEKINSQLTRCRCYVVASGRNANQSDITLDAIKNSITTIYNMPLVARLYKRDDGNGWAVGAHDSEWVWNANDELEINDLTIPYGVVPENCNPEIEEVLETDGITKNHYLVVDVLIWSGRYNIMDASAGDDVYFNQSCELLVNKGHYDSDGYYIIEDYTFSALCLLGRSSDPKYNRQPCFPSARIEKIQYSLDEQKFKSDFAMLMQEIKQFNSSPPLSEMDDLNKNQKKEDENLDKEIKFSDICEKIRVSILENTYSNNGKKYEKYHICAIHENSKFVDVIDREDNYSVYKIPYVATQTNEELLVSLDYDNKVEKTLIVGDKTESIFDIVNEIKTISDDSVKCAIESETSKWSDQIADITAKYEASLLEIGELKRHLEVYESEKRQLMEKQHRDSIDMLINSKRDEMGTYSAYLEYCLEDHYAKTIEQVQTELKEIHYNFMLKNNPTGSKNHYALIQSNVVADDSASDPIVARWGAENAKYFKQ